MISIGMIANDVFPVKTKFDNRRSFCVVDRNVSDKKNLFNSAHWPPGVIVGPYYPPHRENNVSNRY